VEPLNVGEYEALADDVLDPGLFAYYAGGAEDEHTMRENVRAWPRWQLRPRVLVDVTEVRTDTSILGSPVALPVLLAPLALQGLAHPEGERAAARAAARSGTVTCLSTLANVSPSDLAADVPEAPRWFQLYCYRDGEVTRALVEEAAASGFSAIVLTVDAPVVAKRERDLRSGFSITPDMSVPSLAAALGSRAAGRTEELFAAVSPGVTWRDLAHLCATAGLPVVVKGLLTAEDALLACDHGAAAVVVSNHGGRQLDGVAPTADVLGEVVDAVGGRIEVLVDGGIRRGSDIVRALALGARAVLVGRPALWALAAGGEDGIVHVLELLRDELEIALALCGCQSPAAVTRAHVTRARACS
jgi:isopentenyl diphosphate isomerase/L-lactate dehydrogenase-like FMN-dependent dehydrogenase